MLDCRAEPVAVLPVQGPVKVLELLVLERLALHFMVEVSGRDGLWIYFWRREIKQY